jgi:oligopeptidase B
MLGLRAMSRRAREMEASPPVAARRPHSVVSGNGTRTDPYYWLRDDSRKDPEVRAYLAAENAYRLASAALPGPLIERLYAELLSRIKQDDASVPFRRNGYWYQRRFVAGGEYPVYTRRQDREQAAEEVLLDGNARAQAHDYYQIGNLEVSSDNRILAWAEDTVGRRQYVIRFRDLASGAELADVIENAESDLAWAGDSLLYVAKDPHTLLGYRIQAHRLGAPPDQDRCLYEEADPSFYLSVHRSRSDRLLYSVSQSTVSTEYRCADVDDPALEFRTLLPRERDHQYHVQDIDGRFVIRSNWGAPNFRICAADFAAIQDRDAWHELIPHRRDAFLADMEVFRDFLAVGERSGGLLGIRIRHWADGAEHRIAAHEASYSMRFGDNPEPDATQLRYIYSSLTTPDTVFDYDPVRKSGVLRKRDAVEGGFDAADYQTELVWVAARDGEQVPVSLLYRRGTRRDGTAPLCQYAYGAYGLSSDPVFSSARLSLVDRGFVYAIAHVRGGQELGRRWYDLGRLRHKRNTFEDYIDVTRGLIAAGYADASRVFGVGGSAGGLLIAAVANLAGEQYRGLVAHVPFVDVVTTMLDEGIPLTTNEYDEWGDPRDLHDYAYMLSYSPYDNVAARAYPALLVTTGLWDSQVQYWEPVKWVAKLRALKTDPHPLLLRVNLEAGHGGRSGRFERFRETAEEYAFLIGLAQVAECAPPVSGAPGARAP